MIRNIILVLMIAFLIIMYFVYPLPSEYASNISYVKKDFNIIQEEQNDYFVLKYNEDYSLFITADLSNNIKISVAILDAYTGNLIKELASDITYELYREKELINYEFLYDDSKNCVSEGLELKIIYNDDFENPNTINIGLDLDDDFCGNEANL